MDDKGQGWIIFASVVLVVGGVMRIFDSIWAFRYHGAVPQHLQDALLGHSLRTYGWLYLIVGIVLILCGFGVVTGSQISRWIGIFAAAGGMITAFWWMPFYPIWSLAYVVVFTLVIYALAAYGGPSARATV